MNRRSFLKGIGVSVAALSVGKLPIPKPPVFKHKVVGVSLDNALKEVSLPIIHEAIFSPSFVEVVKMHMNRVLEEARLDLERKLV